MQFSPRQKKKETKKAKKSRKKKEDSLFSPAFLIDRVDFVGGGNGGLHNLSGLNHSP